MLAARVLPCLVRQMEILPGIISVIYQDNREGDVSTPEFFDVMLIPG